MTQKFIQSGGALAPLMNVKPSEVITETREETDAKLQDRFEILGMMAEAAVGNEVRAMIVSGPAGLGKSYTVEEALMKADPQELRHIVIKGYIRPTQLYKTLYKFRHANCVVVFDDADTIFGDETSLNILKAVADTMDRRRVSYMTEGVLVDDDSGERVPNTFDFDGSIIFITNMDFDDQIERGSKYSEHMRALVSRSHYIDMAMHTVQDYIVRIHQVVAKGLLKKQGLDKDGEREVMSFIEDNKGKLRELSLRIAIKIATIYRTNPKNWERIARVTCCKA